MRVECHLDVVTYQVEHDVKKFRKQIVYLDETEEAMHLDASLLPSSLPHIRALHAQSLHKYVPVLKWMFVIYCNHRVFAHILVRKGLVCHSSDPFLSAHANVHLLKALASRGPNSVLRCHADLVQNDEPTSPVAGENRKRKPKRIRKNLDIDELVKVRVLR